MKPFYGIDRTVDKKNTVPEGGCFIAATVSQFTQQSYEQAVNTAAEQSKRTRLPGLLHWTRIICTFMGTILFLSFLRALGDVTLAEAYENAPFLFWLLGICALGSIVLTVLAKGKEKAVRAGEEFTRSARRLEAETDRAFRELQVPETAKEVDVVRISHRWKDGKLKVNTQGGETTPYTNVPLRVFRREEVLCLADATHRYEIPLCELRRLRRVKKPLVLQGWNKDESTKAEFYKPYKLTVDEYGRVRTRAYGLLELNHAGTDWALWLPPYELNYISALTGLPITEE